MNTEFLKKGYEKRVLAFLFSIAKVLSKNGYQVDEPSDMSDVEYSWTMPFRDNHMAGSIDFTIVESSVREGTKDGVAFSMSIVEDGGRLLGELTPFNYYNELWIPLDKTEEIEERFSMIESTDPDSVIAVLAARYNSQSSTGENNEH